MFAEIVLAKASRGLDRIYHYSIPDSLSARLKVGHQVRVPFGSRSDLGYVVGFAAVAEVEAGRVKELGEIVSEIPLFTEQSVELIKWLATYYSSFFITALRLVMPPGQRQREKKVGSKQRKRKTNTLKATPNGLRNIPKKLPGAWGSFPTKSIFLKMSRCYMTWARSALLRIF